MVCHRAGYATHYPSVVVQIVEPAPTKDRFGLGDTRADARLVAHVELDDVQLRAFGRLDGFELSSGVGVPGSGNDHGVRGNGELADEFQPDPARCAADVEPPSQSRSYLHR